MTFALPHFSTDLTGQTALVTGASSGLGARFSRVLAACGAKVVLAARREERLEKLAAEIRAKGGRAETVKLDVSNADECVETIGHIERAHGLVSILINNAGVPDAQHATKLPLDKIDLVFDTNLRAPFVLACEVARRLIAAKKPGRVVNIASMSAFEYSGGGAALYSITKAGIVRLTEVLAVEWAKFGINVNGIAPGVVESEMTDGMFLRMGDGMVKGFPRNRIGDVAHLDGVLLFLVSPSSEFITGTIIKADDGQGAR
ncbi:MAG TPA: SDR family NAD(P)-dependent oxidoreductase [Rhizomicrobium sp.]